MKEVISNNKRDSLPSLKHNSILVSGSSEVVQGLVIYFNLCNNLQKVKCVVYVLILFSILKSNINLADLFRIPDNMK